MEGSRQSLETQRRSIATELGGRLSRGGEDMEHWKRRGPEVCRGVIMLSWRGLWNIQVEMSSRQWDTWSGVQRRAWGRHINWESLVHRWYWSWEQYRKKSQKERVQRQEKALRTKAWGAGTFHDQGENTELAKETEKKQPESERKLKGRQCCTSPGCWQCQHLKIQNFQNRAEKLSAGSVAWRPLVTLMIAVSEEWWWQGLDWHGWRQKWEGKKWKKWVWPT